MKISHESDGRMGTKVGKTGNHTVMGKAPKATVKSTVNKGRTSVRHERDGSARK